MPYTDDGVEQKTCEPRLLILTYYFPPNTATAAFRPLSWVKEFSASAVNSALVTRHWRAQDLTRESYSAYNYSKTESEVGRNFTIHRVPYLPSWKRRTAEALSFLPPLRKLFFFGLTVLGEISVDMDARHSFKLIVQDLIKTGTINGLVVTCPPFNLLRLAHEMNRQFGIPYAVDFRDLWNNQEMQTGFRYFGSDRLYYTLIKRHIARWLKGASLVTGATGGMCSKVHQLGFEGPTRTVLNGYEDELYLGEAVQFPDFTISCVGTLYPNNDFSAFIGGVQTFLREVDQPERVKIRFIGADINPQLTDCLRHALLPNSLTIKPRVARSDAIAETRAAHVLFCPGFRDLQGLVPTKIFDYLAARRNILLSPGDAGELNDILVSCNAGLAANRPEEILTALRAWYSEWKLEGTPRYRGYLEVIQSFSRQRRAALMLKYLSEFLPLPGSSRRTQNNVES